AMRRPTVGCATRSVRAAADIVLWRATARKTRRSSQSSISSRRITDHAKMHSRYAASVEARIAALAHDRSMSGRRQFLGLLAGAALSSAVRGARAAKPESARRTRIRAVAFDLFTIFDPRSVVMVAETIVPGRSRELCESWRVRQFEYTWLHTAAGTYRDFHAITEDALAYAARAQRINLSADAARTLVASYERLAPWADSRAALESMKRAGLRLA